MFFIVYPFDWRDEDYTSNTKAPQRWEQCLKFVKEKMRPALEILVSKSKERNPQDVDAFVKTAINDFKFMIKTANESVITKAAADKTLEKLNKIKVLSDTFASNFTEANLEEYYQELKLKGDEGLVESALAIEKFTKKVNNMYKNRFDEGSKISLDSSASSDNINYNTLNDEFSKFSSKTFNQMICRHFKYFQVCQQFGLSIRGFMQNARDSSTKRLCTPIS